MTAASNGDARFGPAITFDADGYNAGQPRVLGRHVAGSGFLRAMVEASAGRVLVGHGARPQEAEAFEAAAQQFDPNAKTEWIPGARVADLAGVGVLYHPDPLLGPAARQRLRTGLGNHSLCGVTHTTATARIMDGLAGLLTEPLAPWDAVVCTSAAVVETVRQLQDAEADYLRWKLGAGVRIEGPQLPVIPLGVHCADYEFQPGEREAARLALGLEPEEVAALFVGRLTITTKANPFPSYLALQAAAERTGRRLALIQCGWHPNETIADAFNSGAATFAPDVRVITLNAAGHDPARLRSAWAAADLFLSLTDNLQETFGLTPVEAMAAGLPCVVSDWNGYRDTVRDGLDGFRVRTWAPGEGSGRMFAAMRESGALDEERYCWGAAAATSVDLAQLTERLEALVSSPELRRTLGQAGRARARAVFDWTAVIAQYQALWAELNARRAADRHAFATGPEAPRARGSGLDPFRAFAGYPSETIGPETVIHAAPGATPESYAQRVTHRLFLFSHAPQRLAAPLLAALQTGPLHLGKAAEVMSCDTASAALAVGTLAKMGLVRLT